MLLDRADLARLDAIAREQGRSRSALIRDAVRRLWLLPTRNEGRVIPAPILTPQEKAAENQAWDELLQRVQSRIPPDITPEEIEADITAAREEVKALRRAASGH